MAEITVFINKLMKINVIKVSSILFEFLSIESLADFLKHRDTVYGQPTYPDINNIRTPTGRLVIPQSYYKTDSLHNFRNYTKKTIQNINKIINSYKELMEIHKKADAVLRDITLTLTSLATETKENSKLQNIYINNRTLTQGLCEIYTSIGTSIKENLITEFEYLKDEFSSFEEFTKITYKKLDEYQRGRKELGDKIRSDPKTRDPRASIISNYPGEFKEQVNKKLYFLYYYYSLINEYNNVEPAFIKDLQKYLLKFYDSVISQCVKKMDEYGRVKSFMANINNDMK